MQPTALLYNIPEDGRGEMIRSYLRAAGVIVTDVPQTDDTKRLGALAKIPGFEEEEAVIGWRTFTDEMLVMCAFTRELMDGFLAYFHEQKIAPVALKAMLTPTNMNWTSTELHTALSEEHQMMKGAGR